MARPRVRREPLVAALPSSHRYASEAAIPIGEFEAARVLLPREPPGQMFNAWLRSVTRAHGLELERTMAIASAPWDRRLPPVASGEAVAVMVSEWARSQALSVRRALSCRGTESQEVRIAPGSDFFRGAGRRTLVAVNSE